MLLYLPHDWEDEYLSLTHSFYLLRRETQNQQEVKLIGNKNLKLLELIGDKKLKSLELIRNKIEIDWDKNIEIVGIDWEQNDWDRIVKEK